MTKKFKFVVVGGGTAGWLTALYLKKIAENADITVIKSSDIGILGAGEGVVPRVVQFLNDLGIDHSELIKNAKATIKTGIKFTNWHGDNKSYFHPFNEFYDELTFLKTIPLLSYDMIGSGKSLDDYNLSSFNAKKDILTLDGNGKLASMFALHFDARLLAEYLEKVGTSRGIKVIDDIVVDIKTDREGYVKKLVLEKNKPQILDFVFDCSGFKKLIIDKVYKAKWSTHHTSLPTKKAIPFFVENNLDFIPSYTEAIAMKYGWVWKIPVQGRYGCGYVFDSDFCSEEDAINEINEKFGEQQTPRCFNFSAGFYEEPWIKNCIAIGLSSGFIEPLEATSIWVITESLLHLRKLCMPGIYMRDEHSIKRYNKAAVEFNTQIKDFLQLHYITKRKDTDFWKHFKTNNVIVDRVKMLYENQNDAYEIIKDCNSNFSYFIPIFVSSGVRIFSRKLFKEYFDKQATSLHYHEEYNAKKSFLIETIKRANANGLTHKQYIDLKLHS